MNKNLSLMAIALAFVIAGGAAYGQSSAASAGSSATTQSAVTATPSKWSGSVGLKLEANAIPRTADYSQEFTNSNLFDEDSSKFDATTSFGGKYKFSAKDSFSFQQRIFYSPTYNPQRQDTAVLGNLRLHYSHKTSMFGGEGSMLYRLTLPTADGVLTEQRMIAGFAVIPEINWGLTPNLSVGYYGYFGGLFYSGPYRSLSKSQKDVVRGAYRAGANQAAVAKNLVGVETKSEAEAKAIDDSGQNAAIGRENAYFAKNGQQNGWYYFASGTNVSYSLTSNLSISQGIGAFIGYRDQRYLDRPSTRGLEAATSLDLQATKNWTVSAIVSQLAPNLEGSVDLSTGKPTFYTKQMSFYYPEQTLFTLNTSVSF